MKPWKKIYLWQPRIESGKQQSRASYKLYCEQEINSNTFWGIWSIFFYLQTHQVSFILQLASANRFIIPFTKLCYIKILIGKHNTVKWVHLYTAVASVNCQTTFCKSNIATQRKIYKDAHILWPTNSTPREFVWENNLVQ